MKTPEEKTQGELESAQSLSNGTLAEQPHMLKRFNIFGALATNFSLTAAPVGAANLMVFSVGLGGSSYYVWAWFVGGIMNLLVCLSLAEVAGMFPHTLGK